ncbi:MAG: calcium-binding protein, partial [Caulobacteraceae bacterium]
TFQFCRTGLNLDMASDSTATIENNTYITNGTAHSVGYTNDGLTFTDNNFNNVGDEFNFRNITDDLVFDAEVALAGLTVTGTANDVVVVLGGEGNDWIAGSSRADYLDDNAAGASFESSTASDNDTLLGRGGNDLLIAENGDDFLDGGAGADSMIGGAGNDTYVLNSVLDQITENAAEGTDLVRTSLHSYTLASNLENLSYSGAGAFTGAGNELANVIDGGSNSDSLSGLAGNDTLSGKVGADVLDGGEGNDSLAGGRGSDTYIIDSLSDIVDETDGNGSDTLVTDAFSVNLTGYTSIENATVTGAANLTLMGNSVANQLTGNDGANVINGAGGADRLTGGAGADVFDYNTTADSLKQASDRITDFQQNVDLIDLFGIDAKESTAPNNGFTWIDTAAFTGEGQLRYFIDGEGNTVIQANTDGDKAVEFQLVLTGTYILSDADFVL